MTDSSSAESQGSGAAPPAADDALSLGRLGRLMSPYRRHAAVSSLASMATFGVGVVTGPILARSLGPVGRGELAAVLMSVYLIGPLIALGLPLAAAYYLDDLDEGELQRAVLVFGVLVTIPVVVGLWFLCPVYLSGYSSTAITWARIYLVLLPLFAGTQATLEMRRRRAADTAWNLWRTCPIVGPAIVIVTLALLGKLTLATVLAAYLAGGLGPILLTVLRLRATAGASWSLRPVKVLLPYGWRNAAAMTANTLNARFDQVFLAAAVEPGQLGLYVVAVTIASLSQPVTSGVSLALFGQIRSDPSARRGIRFRRSLIAVALVSCGVAVVSGLLAPFVVQVVAGSSFAGAVTPLRLLLPGQVAIDLVFVISTKLFAEGNPGLMSRAALVAVAVTVLGLVALVPRYGIVGAAITTSTAYVVQLGYLLVVMRRGVESEAFEPTVTIADGQ